MVRWLLIPYTGNHTVMWLATMGTWNRKAVMVFTFKMLVRVFWTKSMLYLIYGPVSPPTDKPITGWQFDFWSDNFQGLAVSYGEIAVCITQGLGVKWAHSSPEDPEAPQFFPSGFAIRTWIGLYITMPTSQLRSLYTFTEYFVTYPVIDWISAAV